MTHSASDKTIFITGAAAGIGRATARHFHARGFAVGLYDVDTAGVEALAQELGERCLHGTLDVRDAEDVRDAVDAFAAHFGRLDVMLNNAGILKMGTFEQLSLQEHHRTFDVNVGGTLNGIAAALPHLRANVAAHGNGHIVNMCSRSALFGVPSFSSYSASKFAIRGLTEGLFLELEGQGIVVTAVLPSFVDTGMVHEQQHQTPLFSKGDIAHSADDIAALVWQAAHGQQALWYGNRRMAAEDRLGHLFPDFARAAMRRLFAREGS